MVADRYTGRHGLNPGGVAFSLGACGVLLFGLTLTAPHFVRFVDPGITIRNIPLDTPPPPKPEPRPQPKIKAAQPIVQRDPIDVTPPLVQHVDSGLVATHVDPPPVATLTAAGGDTGLVVAPVHVPVLAAPTLDPHYAGAFQPAYPSDERLAGHAGRVVVRVLIGTDGRVKDVQQVSAASPAFFEATRRRALEKWRFRPGTRDGVAVEAWQTMAVRFVLDE